MPDPFSETISNWTNFWMLTGSVAATLIGLIFVSVSLHIDVIASARKDSDIRAMARQTFGNFLLIISFAFIFMVPSSRPFYIGAILLILGLWQLARTGLLWLKFGQGKSSEGQVFAASQIRGSLLIPDTICYLTLVYLAIEIMQGETSNLGWMVMVVIWILVSATKSAWDLMLRLAELKRP